PAALAIAALLLAAAGLAESASAGTLDKIRQDGTIRLAYRDDAPPFSAKGEGGEPTGYSVELCRAVAASIKGQLGLANLAVAYVPVTAADRFDAIESNRADLLCEATTATLSRRKHVDFSIPTFLSGASLLIQAGGPTSFKDLDGKKIGVLGGTTPEQALVNSLKEEGMTSEGGIVKTDPEGLELLEQGKIVGYFADRTILQFLTRDKEAAAKLMLADNYLTIEPYALAIPRGDEDFRLAVDTALSTIYRSGEIGQ